ncbi:MAG TPA: DMT family transporter [Anaeromyxobacteraceae bacterium]|nr:DMT family transporter [Anaeromyxobacteraceae bacterium]
MSTLRTATLTAATLACFAANSLLCRAALRPGLVDPATFTAVRLASGAGMLALILAVRRSRPEGGSVASGLVLFLYAAAFSLAYVRIGAGVGALLLFATVQVTMVGLTVLRGTRPHLLQVVGIFIALAGLSWLVLPGASAPDPQGAALMAVSGAAWGVYSLRARSARDAIGANAHSFLVATPLAALFALAHAGHVSPTETGIGLAIISGAVTSALSYSIWYTVVPALGGTRAAAVQLAVPVLAGAGATVFLGEPLTPRIAASGAAILTGIALTMRTSANQIPRAASTPKTT